jgi:hypothetical protein
MAKQSTDGKSESKGEAKGEAKVERKSETPAGPPAGWAKRNAGTIYILAAFGLVVLIAVARAGCN